MSSLTVISKSFYLKSNKARSETIRVFFAICCTQQSKSMCSDTYQTTGVSILHLKSIQLRTSLSQNVFVIAVKLCLCDCWWKETDKEAMLALESDFRLMHIASCMSYRSYVIRRGDVLNYFYAWMWKVKELVSMELWFLSFYSCCCFFFY